MEEEKKDWKNRSILFHFIAGCRLRMESAMKR